MDEQLIQLLIALIPSGAAVLSVVSMAVTFFAKFKQLRAAVKDTTDQEELRKKLDVVLSENRELKKLLIKDIEVTTHVKYKGETNGQGREEKTDLGNNSQV